MKRKILSVTVVVLLIVALICLVSAERYQHAVYWIEEERCFGKATPYLDEFPFIIELFDTGFVSYAYAGEAMSDENYDKAIELLKPLAERNYRDSAQMLNDCIEKVIHLNKFHFVELFRRNDTERVRAVTKRTAPSTHCQRRLAANSNFIEQFSTFQS